MSGIAQGAMQITSTLNEDDSPVGFGTSDIAIQENEIAVFAINRISAEVV